MSSKLLPGIAALLLLVIEPSLVHGQGMGTVLGPVYTTVTTLVGANVTSTVVQAADMNAANSRSRAVKELYLRHNAIALREALVVGAGDPIDELSVIVGVPEEDLPWFASLMRQNRDQLVNLAEPDQLTPDRAAKFFQTVHAIVTEHTCPTYAADVPLRSSYRNCRVLSRLQAS